MKPVLSLLILSLVLYLSACTPRTIPSQPTEYSSEGSPVIISEKLELAAYPGSGILLIEDEGDRVNVWFTSLADLFAISTYFDRELQEKGWFRSDYREELTRYRAPFTNGLDNLRLKIVLEDVTTGRYKLEIR